jgi:hypothetical protein
VTSLNSTMTDSHKSCSRPTFSGLLCDSFVEGTELEHISTTLSLKVLRVLLGTVVGEIDARGSAACGMSRFTSAYIDKLRALLPVIDESAQIAEVASSVQKPEQLPDMLQTCVNAVRNLAVGGRPMLIPGGWLGLLSDGAVMHIVYRTGADAYSFVTCNTGDGLQYHASTPCDSDATPPKIKYATSMRLDDVPSARMLDAGFWLMLFTQVRARRVRVVVARADCVCTRVQWIKQPPSEYHRVELIYDVLLPWLVAPRLVAEVCSRASMLMLTHCCRRQPLLHALTLDSLGVRYHIVDGVSL